MEDKPTEAPKAPKETKPKQPKEKKTFELLDPKSGEATGAKYVSRQARGAALKAANEGAVDIILREVGTADGNVAAILHRFKGSRSQVAWPLPYPAYVVAAVEKATGKPIPAGLNAKGKEKELKAAGFGDHLYWKPNVSKILWEIQKKNGGVKKLSKMRVKKVAGKSPAEAVKDFVKGLVK